MVCPEALLQYNTLEQAMLWKASVSFDSRVHVVLELVMPGMVVAVIERPASCRFFALILKVTWPVRHLQGVIPE